MTRMIIGALLLMFSAQAPSTAGAQTPAPGWMQKVKPGTPVFVTTTTGETVEGIAGRARSDSMVVSTPAGVRIMLLPDIEKVQRRDPGWTGFVIGAAFGAVIGVVASQNSKYCEYQDLTRCRANRKTGPWVGAVGYGLIGWGIDTLVKGRTTVFDKSRASSLSLTFEPRALGARARVEW